MASPQLADLRVLVVDDSLAMRQLIATSLEHLGIARVHEAAEGEVACAMMQKLSPPPDIVICDLSMPGVDGVETIRRLAAQRPGLSVIVCSGLDNRLVGSVALMARQLGIRLLGALHKPFKIEQLQKMLTEHSSEPMPPLPIEPSLLSVQQLADAIHEDWVKVYYQPQIRLADSALVSVEALARIEHPTLGLLPAASFISVAESSGLAPALAIRVMDISIAQLGAWWQSGLHIGCSINISPRALLRADLPDIATELAARAGVPPSAITFELTEDASLNSLEILHVMNRFRLQDFGLAIDDYGAGMSGLQRLKNMPFTELKIDRAFVDGASHDEEMRTILRSSVNLAQCLKLDIVAEGVENSEDWAVLRDVDCTRAQGYFAAKPMPAGKLQGWADSWTHKLAH